MPPAEMHTERVGLARAAAEAMEVLAFVEQYVRWDQASGAQTAIALVRERLQVSLSSESPCPHCIERSAYISKLEAALLAPARVVNE